MAIVYVFTNPAFEDNYVKLGRVADIGQLSREMNSSGLPRPFRCVLAVEVRNDAEVERLIHQAFAEYRTGSASEYFKVEAQRLVAALKLTLADGREVTPGSDIAATSVHQNTPSRTKRTRRRRSSFIAAGLHEGDTIYFSKDPEATAQVLNSNTIEFEGVETSVSNAALTLLTRAGYRSKTINGWEYWMYNGEILKARIERMETHGNRKDG